MSEDEIQSKEEISILPKEFPRIFGLWLSQSFSEQANIMNSGIAELEKLKINPSTAASMKKSMFRLDEVLIGLTTAKEVRITTNEMGSDFIFSEPDPYADEENKKLLQTLYDINIDNPLTKRFKAALQHRLGNGLAMVHTYSELLTGEKDISEAARRIAGEIHTASNQLQEKLNPIYQAKKIGVKKGDQGIAADFN